MKIFLTLWMCINFICSFGQFEKKVITILDVPKSGYGVGYFPINTFDTIAVVLLITRCNDCAAESLTGFAVRQKYVYYGDPMPPTDYSDEWRIIEYLDKRKARFNWLVTIWDYRLKKAK